MPAFRDPETYRDILDALQIGVSVLDLQRKIVFWSDGAEQITGYSRIDVLGHFEKLKSHVEMTVTSERLRIELSESASGTFFDSGSTTLKDDGRELLITLAQELGKLPNKLSIEGPHRLEAVRGKGRLQQLGAFQRTRQCGPASGANQWHSRRSGYASARIRRSTSA